MKTQTYGYVRISTTEQNEARQLAALAEHEIPQRNLFIDRQSGKDFDRPTYRHELDKAEQRGFFQRLMDKIKGNLSSGGTSREGRSSAIIFHAGFE